MAHSGPSEVSEGINLSVKVKKYSLYYLLITGLLLACNSHPELDTPTKGNITIIADENYKPIIDSGLDVFHAIYTLAKIDIDYRPEAAAFNLFMADSVEVIVSARPLNDKENKYFEDIKIVPKVTEIAKDAITIVVHPSRGETRLTVDQIKQILTGQIKDWADIEKSPGSIKIVLDNKNSSCARYVVDTLAKGTALSGNAFAVNTNEEVIQYVSKNEGAFGLIGVNWISDMDDPISQKFVNSVIVVAVSLTPENEAFKPYQAYIATGDYPLLRKMYIISRQGRNGLGTGFASFMASDRGQRIVLKSGLVPATMPIRLVEVKDAMPQ